MTEDYEVTSIRGAIGVIGLGILAIRYPGQFPEVEEMLEAARKFLDEYDSPTNGVPAAWAVCHHETGEVLHVTMNLEEAEAIADNKPKNVVRPLDLT